jgi:hypothetical protein
MLCMVPVMRPVPDASIVPLEEALHTVAMHMIRLIDGDGSALYGHTPSCLLLMGETGGEPLWLISLLEPPPGPGEPREPLGRIVIGLYAQTGELRDIAITAAEEARSENYTDEPKG